MDERKNFLLINLALLGDAVFSSSLISGGKDFNFTICCQDESSSIFKLFSNVVEIIRINKSSLVDFIQALNIISKKNFCFGLNFSSSFRGKLLLNLAKVKKKFITQPNFQNRTF